MTSVRLSPSLESRLNILAQKTNRSKSYYISKALEEFLRDQEDYYLALSSYENTKKGIEKTYSLEEVKMILDSSLKS